ncbi:hypothetical protein [Confluentibacter sediminis]
MKLLEQLRWGKTVRCTFCLLIRSNR